MASSTRTDWYDRARHALADAGYRRGSARLAVLALLDREPCALSAIEIEDALHGDPQQPRSASRASIYRVLDQLEELGLLTKLEIGQGIVRFEAQREGTGHHHHLVCDHCGTLTPFTDDKLEQAIRHASQHVPLNVSEHEVILHGACSNCATI